MKKVSPKTVSRGIPPAGVPVVGAVLICDPGDPDAPRPIDRHPFSVWQWRCPFCHYRHHGHRGLNPRFPGCHRGGPVYVRQATPAERMVIDEDLPRAA